MATTGDGAPGAARDAVAVRSRAARLRQVTAKYGSLEGYDVPRFWADRYAAYDPCDPRPPGDLGLSERENVAQSEAAVDAVVQALLEWRVTRGARLRGADLGCGYGLGLRALEAAGVERTLAVDVASLDRPGALELMLHRFPGTLFYAADVTLPGALDLGLPPVDVVLLLDVAIHVVSPERFEALLRNVAEVLLPGGCLLVSDHFRAARPSVYERSWPLEDYLAVLPPGTSCRGRLRPYRATCLAVFALP